MTDLQNQKYLLSDPLREKFADLGFDLGFVVAPRVGGERAVISVSHLPGCPK